MCKHTDMEGGDKSDKTRNKWPIKYNSVYTFCNFFYNLITGDCTFYKRWQGCQLRALLPSVGEDTGQAGAVRTTEAIKEDVPVVKAWLLPTWESWEYCWATESPAQRNTERGRGRNIVYLLAYSPNTENWKPGQGQVKPTAWNCIWVSHMSGKVPSTWAILCQFPRSISKKLLKWSHWDQKQQQALLWDSGIVGSGLTHSTTMPALLALFQLKSENIIVVSVRT